MEPGYTLEWMDLIISRTLDPDRTDLSELNSAQAEWIAENAAKEKVRHLSLIKNYVFSIADDNKIQLVVRQYYAALARLLEQAKASRSKMQYVSQQIDHLFDFIVDAIQEIMSMIAERFSHYLNPDETVPDSYLAKIKAGLTQQILSVRNILLQSDLDNGSVSIVRGLFDNLIQEVPGGKVTFQNLEYGSCLLRELGQIQPEEEEADTFFSPLEMLLIRLNFNHPFYIRYLTEKVIQEIQSLDPYQQRIEKMHHIYQHFHQVQIKKSVAYDPDCENLEIVIENWFAQEIIYLEKKLHYSPVPVSGDQKPLPKSEPASGDSVKSKVLCILSVDQMALFLKAADELKILSAKSMSAVFKTIAPHLSTPYQEEISWESMRTKTYAPEDRDKKIIIETLEKMIRKISEY